MTMEEDMGLTMAEKTPTVTGTAERISIVERALPTTSIEEQTPTATGMLKLLEAEMDWLQRDEFLASKRRRPTYLGLKQFQESCCDFPGGISGDGNGGEGVGQKKGVAGPAETGVAAALTAVLPARNAAVQSLLRPLLTHHLLICCGWEGGRLREDMPPFGPGLPLPTVGCSPPLAKLQAGLIPNWRGSEEGGTVTEAGGGSLQVKHSFSILPSVLYRTRTQPPLSAQSW
jgi:hypothetical protein